MTQMSQITEDNKTLWVGNLHENVTEELLYELFLQTGPIERLILPIEGEGEEKKHKGQAYVVFQHPESVQYASQVLEGSSLFAHPLALKARALPVTYKKPLNGQGRGRFDNNSLRGGMNKSTTWHGGSDMTPRGRGSYRGRGGTTNYTQNTGYTYSTYATATNQLATTAYWMAGQQVATDATQVAAVYAAPTTATVVDDKKTKIYPQQNVMMYGMAQTQAQQQGMWASNSYANPAGTWVMGNSGDTSLYQGYTDQYGNWYQQQ
ncbi:RNA-binding protein 7 [Biomphalaria glabrata]|nr:myb-like protein AA [Biomphalaria glabrata]KAI8782119.1 myb protein AA [Biomphalaria glabrata]